MALGKEKVVRRRGQGRASHQSAQDIRTSVQPAAFDTGTQASFGLRKLDNSIADTADEGFEEDDSPSAADVELQSQSRNPASSSSQQAPAVHGSIPRDDGHERALDGSLAPGGESSVDVVADDATVAPAVSMKDTIILGSVQVEESAKAHLGTAPSTSAFQSQTVEKLLMFPSAREVRDALPEKGMALEALVDQFSARANSDDKRMWFALDTSTYYDEATQLVYPKSLKSMMSAEQYANPAAQNRRVKDFSVVLTEREDLLDDTALGLLKVIYKLVDQEWSCLTVRWSAFQSTEPPYHTVTMTRWMVINHILDLLSTHISLVKEVGRNYKLQWPMSGKCVQIGLRVLPTLQDLANQRSLNPGKETPLRTVFEDRSSAEIYRALPWPREGGLAKVAGTEKVFKIAKSRACDVSADEVKAEAGRGKPGSRAKVVEMERKAARAARAAKKKKCWCLLRTAFDLTNDCCYENMSAGWRCGRRSHRPTSSVHMSDANM